MQNMAGIRSIGSMKVFSELYYRINNIGTLTLVC